MTLLPTQWFSLGIWGWSPCSAVDRGLKKWYICSHVFLVISSDSTVQRHSTEAHRLYSTLKNFTFTYSLITYHYRALEQCRTCRTKKTTKKSNAIDFNAKTPEEANQRAIADSGKVIEGPTGQNQVPATVRLSTTAGHISPREAK